LAASVLAILMASVSWRRVMPLCSSLWASSRAESEVAPPPVPVEVVRMRAYSLPVVVSRLSRFLASVLPSAMRSLLIGVSNIGSRSARHRAWRTSARSRGWRPACVPTPRWPSGSWCSASGPRRWPCSGRSGRQAVGLVVPASFAVFADPLHDAGFVGDARPCPAPCSGTRSGPRLRYCWPTIATASGDSGRFLGRLRFSGCRRACRAGRQRGLEPWEPHAAERRPIGRERGPSPRSPWRLEPCAAPRAGQAAPASCRWAARGRRLAGQVRELGTPPTAALCSGVRVPLVSVAPSAVSGATTSAGWPVTACAASCGAAAAPAVWPVPGIGTALAPSGRWYFCS
jgi:hypothetical protein